MAAPEIVLTANQYFSGLVNFILFVRMYATNTSKRQRTLTDVLASETLAYGDKKAFMFASLPTVEDYSTTSSLLSDKSIKYSEEFIGDPIKKKISLTYIKPFLAMATVSSSGMSMFVSYILGLIESAKEDYLYNEIMKDLLTWAPTVTQNKEMDKVVNLIDSSSASSAVELNAIELQNQKRIEKTIQKTVDDFSIFTDVFIDVSNTDGTNFKTALDLKDLIFIGNARYLNDKVIDLMATMLRSEYISSNYKTPATIKIPERTFVANSKNDVIGIICHRSWYQWFYHFLFTGGFFDPDTVRNKNILHFWYSKGRLKGLPASRISASYQAMQIKV